MTQDDDLEDDVASEMASASTKITFRQHEATSPQLEPAVDHAAFPSQTILPTELWERIMLLVGVEEMHLMTLVSKQHHMISQTASFRARHFLRRHKRSVAIHKASNYSQLFTAELFETLLSSGAIMSRHYVQWFWNDILGGTKKNGDVATWMQREQLETDVAIMKKGQELYGDSLRLEPEADDFDIMTRAIFNTNHHTTKQINEEIMEILITGRFACFADLDHYTAELIMCELLANHFEVHSIIERNGWDIEEKDFDSMASYHIELFRCGCKRHNHQREEDKEEEERMYQRLGILRQMYPHYKISGDGCRIFESYDMLECVPEIAWDQDCHDCLVEIDRDTYPQGLAVIKRMYYEGQSFQDLDKFCLPFLQKALKEQSRSDSAAGFRVFNLYFPHLLYEVREDIGKTLVEAWMEKKKEREQHSEASELTMQATLLLALEELHLDPLQLARVFINGNIPLNYLKPAMQKEFFGKDIEQIGSVMSLLIDACLCNPFSSKKLRELASTLVLGDLPVGASQKKIQSKYVLFRKQLHAVISTWIIDLDQLDIYLREAQAIPLQTPIGWLDVRLKEIPCSEYEEKTKALIASQDPHSLLSTAPFDWYDFAHVTFTIMRDPQDVFVLGGVNERELISMKSKPDVLPKMDIKAKGCKHLGHRDMLEGADRKSDNVNAKVSSDEDITSRGDACQVADVVSHDEHDTSCKSEKKKDRLSYFKQVTFQIKYDDIREDRAKGSRTAGMLVHLSGRESPAIRDVVLSHALVNGNKTLVRQLMQGDYQGRKAKKADGSEAFQKKPVLPTFAHLLTLQKLNRVPLNAWTESILRGAPFKQGYVKSLIYFADQKDISIEERDRRYWEEGHKDDPPMTSLYRERDRVQKMEVCQRTLVEEESSRHASEMLRSGKQKRLRIFDTGEKSADSDCEAEAEIEVGYLEGTTRRLEFKKHYYDLTLQDLQAYKKSLTLWKDHFELLQWLGQRDATGRRSKEGGGSKNDVSDVELVRASKFDKALTKILQRINDRLQLLQSEIAASIGTPAKREGACASRQMGATTQSQKRSANASSTVDVEDASDDDITFTKHAKKMREDAKTV